jgi:PAS domain-containing protein
MQVTHLFSSTKNRIKSSLYVQILFVALAFTMMIIASYRFVSDIERKHLQKDVKNAISNTEARINTEMLEPETLLAGISETIRSMVLLGFDAETVNRYIQSINVYLKSNQEKRLLRGALGFFGYFDVYEEKFLGDRGGWIPPEDYSPYNSSWYNAAVEANGDIGVTQPVTGLLGIVGITFSRRIFDDNGAPLGVICLEITIDRIRQLAIDTQFAENGYGFLLDQNMELIAHPDPSLLGVRMRNVRSYLAAYEDELREKGQVSEITTVDYRGIKSIVFIEKFYNGWYMGIVTPWDKYFQSTRNMAFFLTALGIALALSLITILARISTEKNRADERIRIMFDAMPLGANIHNKNFDYFDCNEGAIDLFGLSNKREYLEKFYQLSPEYQPDGRLSRERMAELINKAFADGYCRFEWMHQKLNGEPIPCEVTLVRVKYNNEFVVAAYMRDLSELKQMMKEVEQRESLLRMVNSAAGILLSIKDEKSFESSLLKSFELVGQSLEVDRVQIWCNEVIDGELHYVHRYEWLSDCGRNSVPVPIGLHFSHRSRPDWDSLFLRGEYISGTASLMPEDDRAFLNSFGMKSIVIIPMFLEGAFWGIFAINDCHRERFFSDEEIHILTSVGLMMSNAINRSIQSAKMREADERMQIMFDATPLCMNFWDKNINNIDCNEESVKMFGLSSKKEYTERFFELSPEYQPNGGGGGGGFNWLWLFI